MSSKANATRRNPVAVIGTGASGLAAIKACLEEDLDVIAFEASSNLGGLWRYSDDETRGSVYKSTVFNTSRVMSSFSDYPIPSRLPMFLKHNMFIDYLHSYATHFQLTECIRFNTVVTGIRPSDPGSTDGGWLVRYKTSVRPESPRSPAESTESEVLVKAVMICTGHHSESLMATYPGMEIFKGSVIHSKNYRDSSTYKGKRVLVVGAGNSALDIACDLTNVAESVHQSMRDGIHVLPRLGVRGPNDVELLSRVSKYLPNIFVQVAVKRRLHGEAISHLLPCKTSHGIFDRTLVINDDFPRKLANRSILTKPEISSFSEFGVTFVDGSQLDIDVVVFCTGYKLEVPFLEDKYLAPSSQGYNWFQRVFPLNGHEPSLALIGFVDPGGCLHVISELQGRLAARVFSGKLTLPSQKVMMKECYKFNSRNRYSHQKCPFICFNVKYQDELAALIGCLPSAMKYMVLDPRLGNKFVFGTALPAHYRLNGPGAWAGAREYILNFPENDTFFLVN